YVRYGVVAVTEPSRFLRQLPETLYERWDLEEALGAPALPAAPAGAGDPTASEDPDDVVN
ncbi:MAG: hypothetical protein DYH06_07300, partial [Acidobacteria bacterium ACB2]|nr:hypothetical protein [Acidobacteria bacterium ACB2]